ncbi:hypothetical protein [Wenzhouxiangella marina]|uniref:Uncharacterized protein n=2 Tax=Wenzhouxiangella marina TaxID=1579979 RepID=A0A0K0Y012_9GAMM|nr:hypothetical protein [Wenzhouxiangella marina]AKS43227.1 hypothetical protein WM2015_2870 [Wenzhouxiangella marina]
MKLPRLLFVLIVGMSGMGAAFGDEVSIDVVPTNSWGEFQEGFINLQYWDGSAQSIPYSGYFNTATNTGDFYSAETSNFPTVATSFTARPLSGGGECDPITGICYDPQGGNQTQGLPLLVASCLINAMALKTACDMACGSRGARVNSVGEYCGLPHTCICNPPRPSVPPTPPTPPPQVPGSCLGGWMACTPWTNVGSFAIPDQWLITGN